MIKRGIIATPVLITPSEDKFKILRMISSQELRYLIMYWDEILMPMSDRFHLGFKEEHDFVTCGAIKRPRVAMPMTTSLLGSAENTISTQSILFNTLKNDKETDWVLHHLGDNPAYLLKDTQNKNVLRLELFNTLPCPVQDTPIVEILDFRYRRNDELVDLHDSIDLIYRDILKNPDEPLFAKKSIISLQQKIDDLKKVAKEKFNLTRNLSYSAEFNLDYKSISAGTALGYLLSLDSTPETIPLALLGTALASLRVSIKNTQTITAAADKPVLSYLTRADKERIL